MARFARLRVVEETGSSLIWINPDHVLTVLKSGADTSFVRLPGLTESGRPIGYVVEGKPDAVARELEVASDRGPGDPGK